MEVTDLDTNAAFTQYINVVNRAIGENRDTFPFRELLSVGEKVLDGKKIGAEVYKQDASTPHEHFTLRFSDGTFDVQHGKSNADIQWKLNEDHVRNVVADPEPFVDNPARLDLDWMKTRLGLGGSS